MRNAPDHDGGSTNDSAPPAPGTEEAPVSIGLDNDPTATDIGGGNRDIEPATSDIDDGTPEDPSGPWTDEEIESTSRDTLMEENVDPALPKENPDRGPDADTLEINTDVADEEGLTAPEDTVDTHIPEKKP